MDSHSSRGHESDPNTSGKAPSPVDTITARLSKRAFLDHYRLDERRRNKEDGYGSTRNDPSHLADNTQHSPSQIGGCSRKVFYDKKNAPAEAAGPRGTFLTGHWVEDFVEDFLRDVVTPEGTTVRNPVQIAYEYEDLRFSGSTDPVIFTDDGTPLILTEVKTTKNLKYVQRDGPKYLHRCQAHAYAKGLKRKFNLEAPPKIVFIYIERSTLNVEFIETSFDSSFWEAAVEWAHKNSAYRDAGILPPQVSEPDDDDPADDVTWLCRVCEYRGRCKEGASQDGPELSQRVQEATKDLRETGFVELTHYPEDAVVSHLATYDDVRLTPTLAAQYPYLIDDGNAPPDRLAALFGAAPQRAVLDWVCQSCGARYEYGHFGWDGDISTPPTCPDCSEDVPLKAPRPSNRS